MTTFRVTQAMLTGNAVGSLQTSLARLAKVQEQLSTGRTVNRVSDSPVDAKAAMSYRTAIRQQGQYSRNADNGMGWLGTIDTTLSSMSTSVRRARELGLQGVSTGSTSAQSRDALAAEVDQLRQSLISDANTTYLGRPVFGGVTSGATAFDATTGAYVGTPGTVDRTVADGVKVRVDVAGTDVVGPDGASLFDDLTTLSTALRSGDAATMRTTLASLQTRLTTLSSVQSGVGAAYNRIEAASQKAQDSKVNLTKSLSDVEDTDLPKAMVDLQTQQTAYQAALASTARVIQPSLVDFLR